jgi:hypothetical protein
MPASSFFHVGNLLFLMTVAYGFPILIIREIVIRKNFGLLGLLVLGIMYGLYNEALLAKTIFHPFRSPVDTFTTYGLIDSIRIPWVFAITFWHALFAVVFPIALTHLLFSKQAQESWIKLRTMWILGIFSLGIGCWIFFVDNSPVAFPEVVRHFFFIILAWLSLWWVAKRVSATPLLSFTTHSFRSWRAVLLGFLLFLGLFFIPILISAFKLPLVLFYGYFLVALFFACRKLHTLPLTDKKTLVLIGLGGQMTIAAYGLTVGNIEKIITSVIFMIIFGAMLIWLLREPKSTTD